jgi:Cof subfamily protein (haloacid dehalogenase superfamily)
MTQAAPAEPEPALPYFDPRPDIRLIAADMDGTLLDDEHELHDHFWPLVDELHRRKILFAPASGRQYFNLRDHFLDIADEVLFIAENGTFVVYQEREISSDCLAPEVANDLVRAVRELAGAGVDLGAVVCGKRSAYIERNDPPFRTEVDRYYARLAVVDDLTTVVDDVLKVAVYDFGHAERTTAPGLAHFRRTHQVVVSGLHWVDVMNRTANKGRAIQTIQHTFGITPAQTMVFGDFLNDLEMMDAAEYSFAMHNAHPILRERARYVAPPNSQNGVVRSISSVLGLQWHQ